MKQNSARKKSCRTAGLKLRAKNFFIPHAGNNHHPYSLHKKHLLFQAVFVVLIKVILISTIVLMPFSAWLTPDLMQEQSNQIVELTNQIRQQRGLDLLKQDQRLVLAAQNKVNDMFLAQYFAHSNQNKNLYTWLKNADYQFLSAGENLAMGFADAEQVVESWKKSTTHFANIIDPDFKEIGVVMASGEFAGQNTNLMAQFFGNPGSTKNAVIKKDIFDAQKSKLIINKAVGKDQGALKAEVYLKEDMEKSIVRINDLEIELYNAGKNKKWVGHAILSNQQLEELQHPGVLGSLIATDKAGHNYIGDIEWQNIIPQTSSILDQYFLTKSIFPDKLKMLFNISSFYYQILIMFFMVALILKIFINIRKQHWQVIGSTLGLISLSIVLLLI